MTKCDLCGKEINIFEDNYTDFTSRYYIKKIKGKKLEQPYEMFGEMFYVCQKCKNTKFNKGK